MVELTQKLLKAMKPQKEFFIGIDSDGCTFDTMEIKQKECLIPNIIKCWNLQAISKYVREVAEFVNLYSKWRGINRFLALLIIFDLLNERPEVREGNVEIPQLKSLREWVEKETKLGSPQLREAIRKTGDPILKQTLLWSEAVNATVAEMVKGIPPFPFVKESLEKAKDKADIIVVSTTPYEALQREWGENSIAKYVRVICGQELGEKNEHIALFAGGKYKKENMIIVGDAHGDMKAAQANGALFYPINPGNEEKSWEEFYREALDKFFKGEYVGSYQNELIEEFDKYYLPSIPPWEKTHKKQVS